MDLGSGHFRKDKEMKRINKNNLLPWFTDDHGTLPASYLKSCAKFFKSLKQQATSNKPQAASLTSSKPDDIKDYKG
jgi:hypothetical protein